MTDDNLVRILRHVIETYCPIEYADKVKARVMLEEYERYKVRAINSSTDEALNENK